MSFDNLLSYNGHGEKMSFKRINNYYDKKKGFCHEEIDYSESKLTTFATFDEFYNFLNGDLRNIDMTDYNFNGIDLKKYNIAGAVINNEVLVEQGLYDDSYYNRNIVGFKDDLKLEPSKHNKSISIKASKDILEYRIKKDIYSCYRIYYISDIHLDQKIAKKFPERATENEIRCYLKKMIDKLRIDEIDNLEMERNS